jgi:hypothetical protein
MDEQTENHEVAEKKELTDAEILLRIVSYYRRFTRKLDELHISAPMRIILLILLILNCYVFSIFTRLIVPISIIFPVILVPLFYYGEYIMPATMMLNLIISILFIMRYRKHKVIFFTSFVIFLISSGVFFLTLPLLLSGTSPGLLLLMSII